MNGFILVFGMVLVLAVERRFVADRAAVGGPARSRQSRPVAGCPPAAVRPTAAPWLGAQPAAGSRACGQVPVHSRQPPPPVGGGSPVAGCPGARRWQNAREMRSPASDSGNISTPCVPRRPAVARYRRDAFPGGDPWQLFHFMRSRRGLGREKRPFLATYRRRASKTSRLRQDIRAMHPKSAANSRLRIHRAKILP